MLVINNTDFRIIAFIWHTLRGAGEDFVIDPGESTQVVGPKLGDKFFDFPGRIVCQKQEVTEFGVDFIQISKGRQVNFHNDDIGIVVRHHSEDRPDQYK